MADDAADRLVARAIESVLDQVPGSIDTSVPETGAAKLQPWAETAAPVGRNKRPLEDLLHELEARVAAEPDARAELPATRHPAIAFFDRFGRGAGRGQPAERAAPGEGSSRRRRRRRGGGRGAAEVQPGAAPQAPRGETPPSGGRRRRRGRGGGGAPTGAVPGPSQPSRADGGGQRPAGAQAGRRRRGRRGRGSGTGGEGGPPAG